MVLKRVVSLWFSPRPLSTNASFVMLEWKAASLLKQAPCIRARVTSPCSRSRIVVLLMSSTPDREGKEGERGGIFMYECIYETKFTF